MKATILITVLLALIYCARANKKIDEMAIEKACIAETKVSEKEAHDFWEPNFNFDNTTPNMKCQLKCVMEKMNHFKAGVFDADKAAKDWAELTELDAAEAINPKAIGACKNEKGSSECETAFKIAKCIRQFKA